MRFIEQQSNDIDMYDELSIFPKYFPYYIKSTDSSTFGLIGMALASHPVEADFFLVDFQKCEEKYLLPIKADLHAGGALESQCDGKKTKRFIHKTRMIPLTRKLILKKSLKLKLL